MVMMTGPPVEMRSGRIGEYQAFAGERLGQHAFGAMLEERQLAAFERVERGAG